MTTINLYAHGQQLINASKVVIAAGDVNSVELCVDFDSAWDNYTARSATFYTSKNETVQEMLLLNNKCVVPFEVMSESCVLFIGVRGISTDGEAVKTSSIVKYKIVEGATAGDRTLRPTMDLYQQYLAAMKDQVNPIITEFMNEIKAYAEAEVEEALTNIKGTVLWENPDPTAEFGATTIDMDLSEYESFRVVYSIYASASENRISLEQTFSRKDIKMSISCWMPSGGSGYYDYRPITISNTGITIGEVWDKVNSMLIPVWIIGYKH